MTQVAKEIVADFRTSLAAKIAVSGTSGTLQNNADDDGVDLPAGKYCFTLDNDNSQKEHIICDLSGTAITNIVSVSRQGAETAGIVREHRIGASVTITDFSHIYLHNELLRGAKGFDSLIPLKYDADPTLSDDKEFATKKYVDDIAIGGGVDASDILKGITKLSVAPASATAPIAVGDNDTRVPSQDENNALAGTSGTPSTANKFVTEGDVAEDTASKIVRRKSDSNVTVPITPSADTDAASKAYTESFSNKLSASGVGVSGKNSSTETNIFSATVPADTLSTNNAIKIEIPVTAADFNGDPISFTLRLKYGSTTLATDSFTTNASTTNTSKGTITAYLISAGATNSQFGSVEMFTDRSSMYYRTSSVSVVGPKVRLYSNGTAAEDSTGDLTLSVTVQNSSASSVFGIVAGGHIATIIR